MAATCPACSLPVDIGGGRVVPFDQERPSLGWCLLDADGGYLMIGEYGCVAPTRADAVAEGRERHSRGDL